MPTWGELLLPAALALGLAIFTIPAAAQSAKLADGPPPPPGAEAPDTGSAPDAGSPDSGAPPVAPAAADSAPAEPVVPRTPAYDPLHAAKSVEVGTFYMKKGEYDAAIDRFQEAARLQPGLAKPYLLLGQVYEKKGDAGSAVDAYRTYLKLYRTAPDRARILERIQHLENKTKGGATESGSG
jgi:tetratricopeptide (TPR) repeat protein